MLAASADRWNQVIISGSSKNMAKLVSPRPTMAIPVSCREYFFACSLSPAPRQRPTTGIMARFIVAPGTLAAVQTLLATALAAMAAVPRVEVRLLTHSLPIWNMPFSKPDGTPMANTFMIGSLRGRRSAKPATRSGLWMFWFCHKIHTAANTRPISVASAAPTTPMPKP